MWKALIMVALFEIGFFILVSCILVWALVLFVLAREGADISQLGEVIILMMKIQSAYLTILFINFVMIPLFKKAIKKKGD